MSKFEVTGKAVLYTKDGVEVVDAEVRRYFNANGDWNAVKHIQFKGDYLLVGGARIAPKQNQYAATPRPELVDVMIRYAKSKFFRLMLDLMRLAQWEPIHRYNVPMNYKWFHDNEIWGGLDVDFAKPFDEQLYHKYGFNPSMIQFTEARYP